MERVRVAVFLLAALILSCSVPSAVLAAEPAEPGQALVVLKNELAEPLTEEVLAGVEGRIYVAEVAQAVGARVDKVYESLSVAGGTIFALFVSEGQTTEQLIEALKARPEVLAVSPNRKMRMMGKPRTVGTVPVSADEDKKVPVNPVKQP